MRLEGHDMRYFEIVPSPLTRGEAVLAEIVYSARTDDWHPIRTWTFDELYAVLEGR